MSTTERTLPLDGVRVVELGHAVAGPFAAALLGDFGAEVIKIERPGGGDSLRTMGPSDAGVGLWWAAASRNKRSVVIDLKSERGVQIVRDLIACSDVVVENFRPGVLDRLGLGWDGLRRVNPDLVMLCISGYGLTGPYSHLGGFGKIAEAMSGATHLTGQSDEPPLHPGYSLGDTTTGLAGAYGVLLALRAVSQGAGGQVVDLAIYESLFRMIEWQLPVHVRSDIEVRRNGNNFPFGGAFLTGIFETTDHDEVVISAATTSTFDNIVALLREAGELPKSADRPAADEVIAASGRWIRRHDTATVLDTFAKARAVAGTVYDPDKMLSDDHFAARGNIQHVEHDALGSIPLPGVVPSLTETPGAIRWAGPHLGEHTEAVLRNLLNITTQEVDRLERDGVVECQHRSDAATGTVPTEM